MLKKLVYDDLIHKNPFIYNIIMADNQTFCC